MKTSKPFYKKPLFWLPVILLALLATPSAIKIFELYIYHPQTEPAPEDFYIREEDPPFTGFEPLPKEDVEINQSADNTEQIVEHHRDEYKIELPVRLNVQTRAIEPSRFLVYDELPDGELCRATITLLENTKGMTIAEWHKNDKEDHEAGGLLTIISYTFEKIPDAEFEAYYNILNSEQFGVEKSILIEGEKGIYSIAHSGGSEKCQSIIQTVFNGFSLKK